MLQITAEGSKVWSLEGVVRKIKGCVKENIKFPPKAKKKYLSKKIMRKMEENRNKYERKSKEIFTINQSGLQMTANSAKFLSNYSRPRKEIGLKAQVLKSYK